MMNESDRSEILAIAHRNQRWLTKVPEDDQLLSMVHFYKEALVAIPELVSQVESLLTVIRKSMEPTEEGKLKIDTDVLLLFGRTLRGINGDQGGRNDNDWMLEVRIDFDEKILVMGTIQNMIRTAFELGREAGKKEGL